jgi:hypothetical protein
MSAITGIDCECCDDGIHTDTWDCCTYATCPGTFQLHYGPAWQAANPGLPTPSVNPHSRFCQERSGGTGQYSTLQDCENNCDTAGDILTPDGPIIPTSSGDYSLTEETSSGSWLGKIIKKSTYISGQGAIRNWVGGVSEDMAPMILYSITGNHCNGYGDWKNFMYNHNPHQNQAQAYDDGFYGTQTLTWPSVTWDNGNSIPQVGDYFWRLGVVWKLTHVQASSVTVPAGTPGSTQKANVGNGEWCTTHYKCNPIKPHLHCKKEAISNHPGVYAGSNGVYSNKEACLNHCPDTTIQEDRDRDVTTVVTTTMVDCLNCNNNSPIYNQVPTGIPCSSLGVGWVEDTGQIPCPECGGLFPWPPNPQPGDCTYVCLDRPSWYPLNNQWYNGGSSCLIGAPNRPSLQLGTCYEITSHICYTSAAGNNNSTYDDLSSCQANCL